MKYLIIKNDKIIFIFWKKVKKKHYEKDKITIIIKLIISSFNLLFHFIMYFQND